MQHRRPGRQHGVAPGKALRHKRRRTTRLRSREAEAARLPWVHNNGQSSYKNRMIAKSSSCVVADKERQWGTAAEHARAIDTGAHLLGRRIMAKVRTATPTLTLIWKVRPERCDAHAWCSTCDVAHRTWSRCRSRTCWHSSTKTLPQERGGRCLWRSTAATILFPHWPRTTFTVSKPEFCCFYRARDIAPG